MSQIANFDYQEKLVYMRDGFMPFKSANLSIASSAVLYGLSIYTVFSVNKTKRGMMPFRLADHFQRLLDSAHIIGIDNFAKTWKFEAFEQKVKELISINKIDQDIFVRVSVHVDQIVPGTQSRGLSTALSMFIYPAVPIVPQNGARLKTTVWRRVSDQAIPARAKVNGAYVNSILAKQDALDSGYDDCIFLDSQGHVCESSAANIFLVRNGVLITPSTTSDLLEGINRRMIIEIAKEHNILVEERTVDLTELYIADEIFLCGTSAFIAPIIEVDARRIGIGIIGPITKKLSKLHNELLHS